MICGACADGGHDRCEQPTTCTCNHRPHARTLRPVKTLEELRHEERRAAMYADSPPPDDC